MITESEKRELLDDFMEELLAKGMVVQPRPQPVRLKRAKELFNSELQRKKKEYGINHSSEKRWIKYFEAWDAIRKVVASENGVSNASKILPENLARSDEFACQLVKLYFEQIDLWDKVEMAKK